jgi:ADP-ribose pyrophosphatase YjhB (NUDIX family)
LLGLTWGEVDFLEEVECAVIREIAEELGGRPHDLTLLCVVDQIDPDKSAHWVAPVYMLGFDGDPYLVELDKHSAMGWFSLETLPTFLTVATRTALPFLRKEVTEFQPSASESM